MTMLSDSGIPDDLTRILLEAQSGDQSAWETLFRECYPKVRRVVRRRLNRSMRSLYDSTDFASDVMKSLAANLDQLTFPTVESLMAFLSHVAERKVIDEYRKQHSQKRDVDRVQRLTDGDPDSPHGQISSREPTASQFAQANELHQGLLDRHDETGRLIIRLKEEGYSNAHIADETGWNIRKVQRFIENLRASIGD